MDAYDMFLSHEAYLEERLARRPKCDCCDEPIQDDYAYKIDGEIYCEECMNNEFRFEL